jgi:hypothetical protein
MEFFFIRCRGNVYTEPLPSDNFTYANEMGSGAMIYRPASYRWVRAIKVDKGEGIRRHTDRMEIT